MNIRFIFLSMLLSICFLQTQAQPIGKLIEATLQNASPFTIRIFGTEEGIPQHQVTAIREKPNGNILIATANGFVEYNGQWFEELSSNNETKKILCNRLQIDSKTNGLYGLGNHHEFYRITPNTSRIEPKGMRYADFVNDSLLYLDKQNTFWIRHLFTGKQRLLCRITTHEEIFGCGLLNGKVFYSTNEGTFIVSGKTPIKLSDETFYTAKRNPFTQEIYLYGRTGIATYKNNRLIRPNFQNAIEPSECTDIAFSPQGDIYVSSYTGIFVKFAKKPGFQVLDPSISGKRVLALYFHEKEDLLLAGSSDMGLLQIKKKSCMSYFDKVPISKSLNSITQTQDGEIIAASTYEQIFKIDLNGFSEYVNQKINFSSLGLVNGQIWAGTWGSGVFIYENQKKIGEIHKSQLPNPVVIAVFQDRKKRIWIGTHKGIASGTTAKNIRPVLKNLPIGIVVCFYQLKNGDILVGGEFGFALLSEDMKIKTFIGKTQGLIAKQVRSFYENEDGTILIGTYGGGMYYWNQKKLISVNRMPNCLLDDDVFTLAPDLHGNLYLSSNHGLYVVNKQKVFDFISGKTNYLIPFRLGQDEGIFNTEFNGGFQNNYYTKDGKHFFFPTIQGAVVCFFEIPKFRKMKPTLSKVYVNDQLHPMDSNIFPRNTHTVSLRFYCPTFTPHFNSYYQYKLIGPNIKESWSRPTKHGEITFKMLPPGKYTVYMRGINGFNESNPETITYRFTIEKLFYETIWFRTAVFIALIIFLTFITYQRIQYAKNKELRESTYNNTMNELKLKAIQAKMNPHFIFNCLNNIQNLIVMERIEDAEHALSNFSMLLRRFLQQSDHSFISIREEVELLNAYIAVENFRFEQDLDVRITIPESLLNYKIPTLLIQPTIENALLHGLSHKAGSKLLLVEGKIEEGRIKIIIDDNGIGRKASTKLNTYRSNHISHGWKMVQDKINLLKAKYNYVVEFEIIDKPSDSGTIVIFKIPLNPVEPIDN